MNIISLTINNRDYPTIHDTPPKMKLGMNNIMSPIQLSKTLSR